MNKQELIEKYRRIYHVSSKAGYRSDPFSRGEDAGSARCSFEIIDDLKKLDEPQKVKARLAKHWDEDLGDCLWWDFPVEEPPYCGTPLDDDFPKYKTHFTELHIPDEVEEEPKWVVKVDDNAYFVDFFDSLTPHLVDGLGWEVMRLDDKSKADAVALIIGGTAEKA